MRTANLWKPKGCGKKCTSHFEQISVIYQADVGQFGCFPSYTPAFTVWRRGWGRQNSARSRHDATCGKDWCPRFVRKLGCPLAGLLCFDKFAIICSCFEANLGNPTDPAIHEMRPLSTQTMGEHHGHQELWVQRPYTYTVLHNHIDSHKFQRNGRKNLCFWLNHRGRFARVYGPSLGMLGTYMVSQITNRAIVVKNTVIRMLVFKCSPVPIILANLKTSW